MLSRRKSTEASDRAVERRRREDEAGRLVSHVPELASLELAIDERRGGANVSETRHVRRFPVESAPALFILACADKSCQDGGHDVTREIMGSLRARSSKFEGEHACNGKVGPNSCGRVLRFTATATYKK